MSAQGSIPRNVTVAAVQFEPIIGDRVRNLEVMKDFARKAKAGGVQIIVFPELADTGYVFRDVDEVAASAGAIPGGVACETLCTLAQELGVYIVSGLAERDGDRFYNAAVLCGPEGYIGKYRKLHLWNNENAFFDKGNLGLPVFDLPFGRIGIVICYDGWFPEAFRQLVLAGAELVCVPTNWVPSAGEERPFEPMANTIHKAAAHINGIYIACADRIGVERGQPFIGCSVIIGPQGWPVSGPASADQEDLLIAQIDLSSVAKSRTLNTFNHLLGDRRADVYG